MSQPLLYHLIPTSQWQTQPPGPYRAASLDSEGFIHCSYAHQVAPVANQFYTQEGSLNILVIDPETLDCPLKDEDPGVGEKFPHVYGPIPRAAIREVLPLERGSDGRWVFAGA